MTEAQVQKSKAEHNSCKNCGFCKRNNYCYFLGAKRSPNINQLKRLNARRIQ